MSYNAVNLDYGNALHKYEKSPRLLLLQEIYCGFFFLPENANSQKRGTQGEIKIDQIHDSSIKWLRIFHCYKLASSAKSYCL